MLVASILFQKALDKNQTYFRQKKIQHIFMRKVLERVGLEGTHLNIIQSLCNKLTDNILLNGERLEAISLKS